MTVPIRLDDHDLVFDEARSRLQTDGTVALADATNVNVRPRGVYRPTTRQVAWDVGRQVAAGLATAGIETAALPITALQLLGTIGPGLDYAAQEGSRRTISRVLASRPLQTASRVLEANRAIVGQSYGRPATEAGRMARATSELLGLTALPAAGGRAVRGIRPRPDLSMIRSDGIRPRTPSSGRDLIDEYRSPTLSNMAGSTHPVPPNAPDMVIPGSVTIRRESLEESQKAFLDELSRRPPYTGAERAARRRLGVRNRRNQELAAAADRRFTALPPDEQLRRLVGPGPANLDDVYGQRHFMDAVELGRRTEPASAGAERALSRAFEDLSKPLLNEPRIDRLARTQETQRILDALQPSEFGPTGGTVSSADLTHRALQTNYVGRPWTMFGLNVDVMHQPSVYQQVLDVPKGLWQFFRSAPRPKLP